MLDRELRAEFESYRKTLDSEEAKRAFDERIERLLNQHGVDYVRGYVDTTDYSPVMSVVGPIAAKKLKGRECSEVP